MQILTVFLGVMVTKIIALPSDKYVERQLNIRNIDHTITEAPKLSDSGKGIKILERGNSGTSRSMNGLVRTFRYMPEEKKMDSHLKISKSPNPLTRVMSEEELPEKHIKREIHHNPFVNRQPGRYRPPHDAHRLISRLGRFLPNRQGPFLPHRFHQPFHHVKPRHPGRP